MTNQKIEHKTSLTLIHKLGYDNNVILYSRNHIKRLESKTATNYYSKVDGRKLLSKDTNLSA